jgi:anti-anti-sigma factor
MERHRMASAVGIGRRNEGGAVASVANRTRTSFNKNTRAQPALSEPGLVLASVSVWTHTLVLTGELNHRSAHALEAEIERLCQEGVTGITLDLRELTYIDSIGVAVIAFRCGLCERRGYDFALIPGSRLIHRAFEQAGVADLLPFQEDDVADSRPPALVLGHRSRDGCEQRGVGGFAPELTS